MSRRTGRQRLTVRISPENYLALHAAITPPGADGPGFAMLSDFFDKLLDDWRLRRAAQLTNQEKPL